MSKFFTTGIFIVLMGLAGATAQVDVLTYHYDNSRVGANTNETILTPANVNSNSFGRLFSYSVDGYIYAQPLYVSGVNIPGKGVRNVVYVATQHNSIYAFDADSATGGLLWQTNLGVSATTPTTDFGDRYDGAYMDILPEVGITSTPVIDPTRGTLYVDVFSKNGTSYVHSLHALNITNGTEQPFSPVNVTASIAGTGVGNTNGIITFDPKQHLQRSALTLASGVLYVAFASYADTAPYHGWIIGFSPSTLQQLTNYVFNVTPNSTVATFAENAGMGGIWMGGSGLCVDANTNLYFMTGNGAFSAKTNGPDYGDSFVKLSTTNQIKAIDYFTPYDEATLSASDGDLGSGGPILLPNAVGNTTHPHLMVGWGKNGTIYLVDRDNMGKYRSSNNGQIVQSINFGNSVYGTPAYFNNSLYFGPSGLPLTAFRITNNSAAIITTPISQSPTSYGFPGARPVVTANGTNNGIVWALQCDAYDSGGPTVLHAYNATNLAQELYNSSQNLQRDNPGPAVKMVTPIVADGKVFVGAQYTLSVFGTAVFLSAPVISPAGGVFTNSVTITITNAVADTTIYYTTDGTAPATNSTLYTGPFQLTNSANVQAFSIKAGAIDSPVASVSYVNSSAVGSGTGLTGVYYANQIGTFNDPADLTRVDPTIDFAWDAEPGPGVSATDYTVRWTGCLQPQFTQEYTLYVTADDWVRLWINDALLVDSWGVNQWPTTYSTNINLNAQQLYNIRMEYYHSSGIAAAQLEWSGPMTSRAIIPSTQLYSYTNPPPGITLTSPASNSTYTASASITISANAAAQYNTITHLGFYTNDVLIATLTNNPYTFTATDVAAGNYVLTAVAEDGSGLMNTSAPVNFIVVTGSSAPYGLTSRPATPAFFNMPTTINGTLPPVLSQTGLFDDTTNLLTVANLIPFEPNTALWSDGAAKKRWMALPYNGGLIQPNQQITFSTNGEWSFPSGSVFVKHFDLATDETNTNILRRLETRLLVRDPNGSVYGVTYRWRPDNSDADLVLAGQNEDIVITNATGVRTQTWYYPSPADCLACHTPSANYVLGVKTRQLNGDHTYTFTGVTDNQLRTLNHLGLFNPAIDEAAITNLPKMVAVDDLSASLTNRFRSYIDANCSHCHRPGGTGTSFDARYDTPLASQNIINGAILGNLGYDNAHVVTPKDIWRSILYQRANSLNPTIKMPPLARNVVDTNAMSMIAAWINSLPGIPALSPPTLEPAGGTFGGSANVSISHSDTNATLYYTLDGSLPTTASLLYTGPVLITNTATLNVKAFENGFTNSVAANGLFTIVPPISFNSSGIFSNGVFQVQVSGIANLNYIFQGSTDLVHWVNLTTNLPLTNLFELADPAASNFPSRFYRAVLQP